MAEQCARLWVEMGATEMFLVGRNLEKLERIAADLRVRSPESFININQVNFLSTSEIEMFADRICEISCPDIVLIAHGTLPNQAVCQQSLVATKDAIEVNALSPVLFAEAFALRLEKAGKGTLALIGSVAGDRGRKSNYVYGAAKGLVTRYAQGLQHRFSATNVRVVLIKPGPTDTPMTAEIKAQGVNLASVKDVAETIVKGIEQGKPVVYAPFKWSLIMMVIRHLPSFVFNRMNI